ncbi:MAG: molybdopterin cofactor-binding domain-containing protein [Thermoanaerobaculia bacterium]
MKHIDAAAHTRGESQFVDDAPPLTDMLHAAVFGSPVAHGEITALHLDGARAISGVVAVLTAADIPGENQIGPIIQDEPLLAEDEVHFVGQPIAVVVAESPEIARKGVRALAVDVAERPVVTDPRQAFELGQIIGQTRTFRLGDVDAAWEQCHRVLEGSCDVGGQEHVYLETQRARAMALEGRAIRIHASTQSPSACQRMAAKILGLQFHAVEIDVKRLGGGFGGKEDQATPWACMAALAAWTTRRPVELVLRRDEDGRMTGKRHPYKSDFKIGVDEDGKILAFEAWHYQNAGAAADLSPAVLERTLFHGTNSYYVPNVRLFGVSCRTNLPPNTAFRGFGGPQGMFAIESAIAKAAEALDMPREDLQRRNLIADGDLFPYGQRVLEGRAVRTWDEAAGEFGLAETRRRIEDYNRDHFDTKKGLAVMPICFGISFTNTSMNQASALVHVYTDGSVSVSTGGVEMGQGLITNIAKITALTFGISAERIKVESTNTTRVANMSPSAASATTLLNGNAAMKAAEEIRERLKAVVAGELGVPAVDLVKIVDEKVLFNGHETGWTWERLVRQAYLSRVSLSSQAFFATPNIWFDKDKEKGRPFAYHTFGTALVEVTLDAVRGIYDVDAVKIVHDLGRTLNEKIDLGQVEGGLAQGLGWMTMEELRYGDDGRNLTGALATYKVPDVYFMPDDLQVRFLENAGNPLGPFHSKAVGEPPLMYGIGVFFALRDAMQAFRRDPSYAFSSPLTPEKVLMELHKDRLRELVAVDEVDAVDVEEPALAN